jgi:uncharacterized membrane protein YfcA
METVAMFLTIGAIAGLLAGLFGVGGGIIVVPALALVLPRSGMPGDVYMQVAIGTSLAVIAATSLSSARAHHVREGVRWDVVKRFAPALAGGALAGAFVADQLSGSALKQLVGLGALLVAAQILRQGRIQPTGTLAELKAPELVAAGGGIGLASSLVGIGGGSLTVPYFLWRGMPIHHAIGTAAACGVPIAWAGALGFIITGWDEHIPPGHLGYVNIAGFFTVALASVSCAPLGAMLAHWMSPTILRRAFAALLIVIGLKMLLG